MTYKTTMETAGHRQTTQAKSQYEQMQEAACAALTEQLRREHPEWNATLSWRFGQVVIEAIDAEAVRAWCGALPRRYGTMNQDHLRGASDHKRLPKLGAADGAAAEDIGDGVTVKNEKYRGEVPEPMEHGE